MHNEEKKVLSDHQEMYLKTIYTLIEDHKVARVKEIAEVLNVTKSSVSGALKSLSEKGLIKYEAYSYVDMTEKGQEMASMLLNKFDVFTDFLMSVLEVPEDVARENACRMEHVVDDEVMHKLIQFMEFCKSCEIQCWKDISDPSQLKLAKCCMKEEAEKE